MIIEWHENGTWFLISVVWITDFWYQNDTNEGGGNQNPYMKGFTIPSGIGFNLENSLNKYQV